MCRHMKTESFLFTSASLLSKVLPKRKSGVCQYGCGHSGAAVQQARVPQQSHLGPRLPEETDHISFASHGQKSWRSTCSWAQLYSGGVSTLWTMCPPLAQDILGQPVFLDGLWPITCNRQRWQKRQRAGNKLNLWRQQFNQPWWGFSAILTPGS